MRDEKYIESMKKKLLRKYPVFGSTINTVDFKMVDESFGVSTAGTNGKKIYVCDQFVDKLNDKEQLFLFAHEVAHIALNHVERRKGKEPQIWNIACDAVINKYLERDNLPIIEGGVNISDARNYDAEELYYKFMKKMKDNMKKGKQGKQGQGQGQGDNQESQQQNGQGQSSQGGQGSQGSQGISSDDVDFQPADDQQSGQGQSGQSQQGQQQGGQGSGGGTSSDDYDLENPESQGHASHDMWGKEMEDEKEENKKGSGKGDKDQDQNQDQQQGGGQGQDEKDQEIPDENRGEGQEVNKGEKGGNSNGQNKNEPVSEREEFDKNQKEVQRRAQDVMNKIQGSRGRGFSGEGVEAIVGEVGEAAKPVTNWKKNLKRILEIEDEVWGHRFSDAGNNWAARIEDVEIDEEAETEIVLDTSGSISMSMLRSFLKQVKTVLKVSKIKVGEFNDHFYGFQELKCERDIDELRLNIGGGTNFDAASKAFSKDKYVNKICFTDGQDGGNAGIREKRSDILWITFDNQNFKPDNGKVLYVPLEEIENFETTTKEIDKSADDDYSM